MGWLPTELTRGQLEERRKRGGQLLREGKMSKTAIANELGVHRTTVHDWDRKIRQGGLRALNRTKAPGNPSKLTRTQERKLIGIMKHGAIKYGFPTERWTLPRIAEVVRKEFGVVYHANSLGRVMKRLGFSPQQPKTQATERDEVLIRAWLSKDWERIKKSASQAAKHHISR